MLHASLHRALTGKRTAGTAASSHHHPSHPCLPACPQDDDFYHISLDVRGKRTLGESLDSYVSKELMDGTNQYKLECECGQQGCYKCEQRGKKVRGSGAVALLGGRSCPVGRLLISLNAHLHLHLLDCLPLPFLTPYSRCGLPALWQVDAEKRVLIRQLPHTLALHLKRFEWDYETYQRWKVGGRVGAGGGRGQGAGGRGQGLRRGAAQLLFVRCCVMRLEGFLLDAALTSAGTYLRPPPRPPPPPPLTCPLPACR